MGTPWILVRRHLAARWLRSSLTAAAIMVALFLLCFLVSIVASLDRAVEQAAGNRLVTQSAVSLFVDLPLSYQGKIASVPGVQQVTKFQYFGGYYRERGSFFAQFGVDHDAFFDMFARDLQITEGPDGITGDAAPQAVREALAADRRAAVIGTGLVRDFGWQPGDTVPLMGTIFQRADGTAWEFNVVGVYRALKGNIDDRTLWFRFDYLEEALDTGAATGPIGCGVYESNLEEGASLAQVSAAIDGLFHNGPQATMTTSEAAFQASFVSMQGNLPLFLGTIGGAVVFAVFFSVINTMLMAGRQSFREMGILKALGFGHRALAGVLMAESIAISGLGGLAGIGLARLSEEPLRVVMGSSVPNYAVTPQTFALAFAATLIIGIVAGVGPALAAMRLDASQALRSEG